MKATLSNDDWLAAVFARFTQRLANSSIEGAVQALQGGLVPELRSAATSQVDTIFDRRFEQLWDQAGQLLDQDRITLRRQLEQLRSSRIPLDFGPVPELPDPPKLSLAAPAAGAVAGATIGATAGALIGRGAPPVIIGTGVAGATVGAGVGAGVAVARLPTARTDYIQMVQEVGSQQRRNAAEVVAMAIQSEGASLDALERRIAELQGDSHA